jgi:dTMP kinase
MEEIWSYNQYVLPPDLTVYLDEAPQTIRARLASRASLTRLERTGSPDQERALYREAAAFLGRPEHRWRQHTIDCRGCTPGQVVEAILDRLDLSHPRAA